MTTIETARLLLRPLAAEDEGELAQVYCDAETMIWYPRPYTRGEVRQSIAEQMGRYASGSGLMGMVDIATGKLIGDCGVIWQDIGGVMEPEVGYHVHRGFWNRGYATEAAKAMIDHAFGRLGVDHVISMIRPENLQSRRVAEKNGLVADQIVFWRNFDHCVYKLWK